jgi:hypothetical protein
VRTNALGAPKVKEIRTVQSRTSVGNQINSIELKAGNIPAGRPTLSLFSLIFETCGLALAALEPGRCRCGTRRGLGAQGAHGAGGSTDLIADRHKRCNALGQDQWITSVTLTTLLVIVAFISAGMIVNHFHPEYRKW